MEVALYLNIHDIHLFRWLLLSLLDDLLNAFDEKLIHLVSSFVGKESHQMSGDGWKSNWTHKANLSV